MTYKLVPKSEYVVVGQGERTRKKSYSRAGGYASVLPKCIFCYDWIRHKIYPLVAIPARDGSLDAGQPAHPYCVKEYLGFEWRPES